MITVDDTAPSYAEAPHARTHSPPKRKYSDYRDCLRLDFGYRCVYCLATESEVGPSDDCGGFEIEHFKPRKIFRKLVDHYENLLWVCRACNRAKGDQWPSQAELSMGFRFVDPCAEALGQHLELSGVQVTPVAGSAAGAYMIDEIYLNSKQHEHRRQLRADKLKNLYLMQALVEDALQNQSGVPPHLQTKLDDYARKLATLRGELAAQHAPWDPSKSCGCVHAPIKRLGRLTRRERKALRASASARMRSARRPNQRARE